MKDQPQAPAAALPHPRASHMEIMRVLISMFMRPMLVPLSVTHNYYVPDVDRLKACRLSFDVYSSAQVVRGIERS